MAFNPINLDHLPTPAERQSLEEENEYMNIFTPIPKNLYFLDYC